MLPIITALLPVIGGVLDKIIPDPEAKAKAQAELASALMAMDAKQLEVNAAEAASEGNYKGGWRPFIGWVCGAALAWQFVLAPIALWASQIAGVIIPSPPSFDGMLWELMFGMLGMGALRSLDKRK